MKRSILLITFLLTKQLYPAEVTFLNIDLSPGNQFIFESLIDSYEGEVRTLLTGDAWEKTFYPVTIYPEEVVYLPQEEGFRVYNRFGSFKVSLHTGRFLPIISLPQFSNGSSLFPGKLLPILSSPDGRNIVLYEPTSATRGNLVIQEVGTGREFPVATDLELNYREVDALWSPDSRYLFYQKEGNIYFYSPYSYRAMKSMTEEMRSVGEGSINSLYWSEQETLFYIDKRNIYKIPHSELLTRAPYSRIAAPGDFFKQIPFVFDAEFDTFYISSDESNFLINKNNEFLFIFSTSENSSNALPSPFLNLKLNQKVSDVVWVKDDTCIVLIDPIFDPNNSGTLLHVTIQPDGSLYTSEESGNVTQISLSPDGNSVALLLDDGIRIMNRIFWREEVFINFLGPRKLIWLNSNEFVALGEFTIESFNLATGEQKFLTLSQVEKSGFSFDEKIIGIIGNDHYEYDQTGLWTKLDKSVILNRRRTSNKTYRVYIDSSGPIRGLYNGKIIIREQNSPNTNFLFEAPTKFSPSYLHRDQLAVNNQLSFDPRVQRREVSLVFNVKKETEGLLEVLEILRRYKIKGTFFINGEAMTHNPEVIRLLSESDNEIGSLFHLYFDLTDMNYAITAGFIQEGLSWNENTYFNITGKELLPIWHAPYYMVNREILMAAARVNYTYIDRNIDPLDWVGRYDKGVSRLYKSANEIVERVMLEKTTGTIIPIMLGANMERDDYFFQKLELLINGLYQQGYAIVPATELISYW